jgi:hypothetical protein
MGGWGAQVYWTLGKASALRWSRRIETSWQTAGAAMEHSTRQPQLELLLLLWELQVQMDW